jgi:ligand-binding sensor protein
MTVSFPDREGNIVFYPDEERSPFCHLIQCTKKGRELCQCSDKHAADIAMRERRPMFYTCHAGLIDVVVPVVECQVWRPSASPAVQYRCPRSRRCREELLGPAK